MLDMATLTPQINSGARTGLKLLGLWSEGMTTNALVAVLERLRDDLATGLPLAAFDDFPARELSADDVKHFLCKVSE